MRLLLAATLLSLVPLAAQADPVRAEAETRTIDCAAGPAEVEGNRNTLTFTNACRSLRLRGEANTVQIELAPGAQIDVEGNGNRVRYGLPGGAAPPAVRVSGSNTDLAPDGGVGAARPTANGDADRRRPEARGRLRRPRRQHPGQPLALYAARRLPVGVRAWRRKHGRGRAATRRDRRDRGKRHVARLPSLRGGDPQVTVRGNNSRASRSGEAERPSRRSLQHPPLPRRRPLAATRKRRPPPPRHPTDAGPSLPQLMHDLGAKVVAEGTLVAMPGDTMFGADPDQLRPEAAPRLTMLAQLAARIHPSGVRVSARAAETSVADRGNHARWAPG